MSVRRGAGLFWTTVAALWLFLAVMAYLTPVTLDDWYQVGWLRHHELTPAGVLGYAHYNYFHYNPRLGETFLLLVNGPWPIHALLTPLVELGLVVLVFALALGRWPRPSGRDAAALVIVQALLWASAPAPGLLWFYRPFTTNYVYGFSLHLLLAVPFRFALAGRAPARWWWAPILFVLGYAAGLTNEHTGPSTIVAVAVCGAVIVRRGASRATRAWVAAGVVGVALGYVALYFAPGQRERYGGTGAGTSPLGTLVERGLGGGYDAIVRLIVHAQAGLILTLVVVGVAVARAARRGRVIDGLGRGTTLGIAGLLVWAGAILLTLLLSPLLGERLYFAPAVLLVIACAIALEAVLRDDRGLARVVTTVAALIVVVHAAIFLVVQAEAHADATDRWERLSTATPGSIAIVPPLRFVGRSRWFWGDDFVYASLREYVAHDVFGLGGIELEGAPRWAEPSPPFRMVTSYRYEPPLARAELAAAVPLPDYTPTYWEWAIAQLRKLMPDLAQVGAHRLRELTVTVESDDPAVRGVLRGRALLADRWQDGQWSFVYSRRQHDPAGWPLLSFIGATIPADVDEAYLVGCGEARPIAIDRMHTDVAFQPRCGDMHLAILCSPRECWLGGTYARFEP